MQKEYIWIFKTLILFFITAICLNKYVHAEPFEYRYSKHWNYVYHKHNELSFQHVYCSLHNGTEEYELPDKTRVDCLTNTHAIEFDFADKWYESIGQALHYGLMSCKKPKIVLILDKNKEAERIVYFNRVKNIGKVYNIDVEYITENILNLDKKNKYQYLECKCHRKRFF